MTRLTHWWRLRRERRALEHTALELVRLGFQVEVAVELAAMHRRKLHEVEITWLGVPARGRKG